MIKEEVYIRKRVVEVEVELRKEEVEIGDQTTHGSKGALRKPPTRAPLAR